MVTSSSSKCDKVNISTLKSNQCASDCHYMSLFVWLCLQWVAILNYCLCTAIDIIRVIEMATWQLFWRTLTWLPYSRNETNSHWTLLLQTIQSALIIIIYAGLFVISICLNLLLFPLPNLMSNQFTLFQK